MNLHKTSPRTRRFAAAVLAVSLLAGLSACGDDKKSDDTPSAAGAPQITAGWARTSPAMATTGAAYMTIKSAAADKLVKAGVDSSVAAKAEIHEVVPDTSMSSTPMSSTPMASTPMSGTPMSAPAGNMPMKMQEVEYIDIPAGTAVELKPGGYHVMLVDLTKPLETGQKIEITLSFEKAGDVKVSVPVQDAAP